MDRTILYIINPISGRGNKKEIKEIIEEETKKTGLRFFVFPSVIDGDYSALFPMVQDEKITDVVIAGGDGTINQVVDAFKHLDVNFGIIPCGSGNGLAFSAGISKNIKKALHTIFAGTSKWTDSFLINDHFACMLCGVGFDAQVAHDFGKAPRRGLATYIQKTISNFIIAKTYPFTLITKQKEIVTNAFFISIANSNQFGNHFTIAPKASLTDGLLDVIILTKQNKLSVLLQVIKQISGYN
ncbi:MAG TPA: diacylglycerol kinase family protein, partial [Flavisolibacter sp.]|nr:diacylglycerol kinase family protein [Flavisolibacter sp.]